MKQVEQPLKELAEAFGSGPLWLVTFWRTKKVIGEEKFPDLMYGVGVFVYGSQKAALVDFRTAQGRDDVVGK